MQNKSLELTESQIKAYENGATMFIVPILRNVKDIEIRKDMISYTTFDKERDTGFSNDYLDDFIERYAPILKGDKDIWVKHDIVEWGEIAGIPILNIPNTRGVINFIKAKEMTKEQSKYTISECIDVRVVRVQDIRYRGLKVLGLENSTSENVENEIKSLYNNQLKEQNINRTYEDNDYIFLIEVKR